MTSRVPPTTLSDRWIVMSLLFSMQSLPIFPSIFTVTPSQPETSEENNWMIQLERLKKFDLINDRSSLSNNVAFTLSVHNWKQLVNNNERMWKYLTSAGPAAYLVFYTFFSPIIITVFPLPANLYNNNNWFTHLWCGRKWPCLLSWSFPWCVSSPWCYVLAEGWTRGTWEDLRANLRLQDHRLPIHLDHLRFLQTLLDVVY